MTYGYIKSFKPVADENAIVLILGTMPGIESLRKKQYYGHKQNCFWKIIEELFNNQKHVDYESRKNILKKNNIALWDVLKVCTRKTSDDGDIRNEVPNNFDEFLSKYKNIKYIFFNGKNAEKFYKKYVLKNSNLQQKRIIYRVLPSTSPANARIRPAEKLEKWKCIAKIKTLT